MALSSYVVLNLILIWNTIALGPDVGQDWAVLTAVAHSESPYRIGTAIPFVWSPVTVPLISIVVAIGYWPWLLAHIAAVLLLRQPLLIGVVLVSVGFWFDAAQGNTLTFSLVAGMLALRGSRWGSLAYFALLILMPRPLMVPLGLWLLRRDRSLWWPVLIMFLGHAVIVAASGRAVEWLGVMVSYSGPHGFISLEELLGAWWLPIALPLAGWLTWRGHFGWAGLAISPYVLPQYPMWPLVELSGRRPPSQGKVRPPRFNDAADGLPPEHP